MRIVSLLPSATEILFAIGAGDDVVGVTHECDYPPPALTLPKLTSSQNRETESAAIDRHVRAAVHTGSSLYALDAALLERLQPDLIVTQELCAVCAVSYDIVTDAVKQLQSFHTEPGRTTRIVSLEPRSLDDVLATIVELGELTDRRDEAKTVVAELDARIATLRRLTSEPAVRPRTLALEWTDPPMSAGHWIPDVVELAGGFPLLANPRENSQRLSWEAIAQADPDAIVVAPCGFDLAATQRAIAALESVPEWRSLRARGDGRVLALDGNAYLSRPGPRLVDAAEILHEWYTTAAEHAG